MDSCKWALTIRSSRPRFTAANFSGMFVLYCRRAAGRLNSGVGLETSTKTWLCYACKKQKHLEHGFPVSKLAKMEVLTVIEKTTFWNRIFLPLIWGNSLACGFSRTALSRFYFCRTLKTCVCSTVFAGFSNSAFAPLILANEQNILLKIKIVWNQIVE